MPLHLAKFPAEGFQATHFRFCCNHVYCCCRCSLQISNELQERNTEPTAAPTAQANTTSAYGQKPLEHHLPAGVSTLYLAGLSGIFLAAALLHPKEFTCLLHGVWYLLCLPSGYLLLTIYSLCNLTDRSWGRLKVQIRF